MIGREHDGAAALDTRVSDPAFAGMRQLFDPQGVPRATVTDDVELLKQVDGLLAQAHKLHSGCGVGTMRNQIAARIRALQK